MLTKVNLTAQQLVQAPRIYCHTLQGEFSDRDGVDKSSRLGGAPKKMTTSLKIATLVTDKIVFNTAAQWNQPKRLGKSYFFRMISIRDRMSTDPDFLQPSMGRKFEWFSTIYLIKC